MFKLLLVRLSRLMGILNNFIHQTSGRNSEHKKQQINWSNLNREKKYSTLTLHRATKIVKSILAQLNIDVKPQSNGPCSNTVIGTLAIDGCGWAATFGTARRGMGGLRLNPVPSWHGRAAAPPSPVIAVPNVAAHPSTACVPISYYSMWH